MRWDCGGCGQPTIRAREIDGNIITLDADPVEHIEDTLVIRGDVDDEPIAYWNVPVEGDSYWNLAAGLPRYRRHNCDHHLIMKGSR